MTEENEKIELEEEPENIVVVDPEDYQKTQKLKAIDKAKKEFKKSINSHTEIYKEMKEAWSNPKEATRRKHSQALALYASELIPLIEEGLESGVLSEDDLLVDEDPDTVDLDIRNVAIDDGHVDIGGERKPMYRANCMEVYRQLERIERKLGLGLELEEEKGPAQI